MVWALAYLQTEVLTRKLTGLLGVQADGFGIKLGDRTDVRKWLTVDGSQEVKIDANS